MVVKKFFCLFCFVFCVLFFISCEDTREIENVNILVSNHYSNELVIFDKKLYMTDLSLNYYTNNLGSKISVNNGNIFLEWDGKVAKVLGGEYIGEYQNYYGFYLGFNELRDILDYNRLLIRLKGSMKPSHVLNVNLCGQDVKDLIFEDIKNEYTDIYIDINLKSLENLSLIGFAFKNRYSFVDNDEGSGFSFVYIEKIVLYKLGMD